MEKRSFIFIKCGMGLGGIETYLIKFIKWLNKNKIRVIFIMLEGTDIAESFKETLSSSNIEIYNLNIHKKGWNKTLKIKNEKNETFLAYAFSLYQFALLQKIILENKLTADSFYWIPHFAEGVFVENEFGFFKDIVRKYFAILFRKMENNNNIIYVNKSHGEAFEENYKFKINNLKDKILNVSPNIVLPFDEIGIKLKSKREKFNIITVTRFVFPHKNYLLGLIDSYSFLKNKYPQLTLTIIGYGEDQDIVLKKINNLKEEIKKDIFLIGKVEYSELNKYFRASHVNIGVASTICDGAICSVVSIPARHYSEICEGYGYLPESKEDIVSSRKGVPIEAYIEELITMDKDQYISLCKASYDTFANLDIEKIWKEALYNRNINNKLFISKFFIFLVYMRYILVDKIRFLIKVKK